MNIENNTLRNNAAFGNGGALDLFVFARNLKSTERVQINARNNGITGNSASGGLGAGGGIVSYFNSWLSATPDSRIAIEGNTITGNTSEVSGGGIGVITTADPNPPSDTQVPLPPPAFAAADVEITGNLIANNDLTGFGVAVTVAYSDVFGHPDGEYSTRVPDRTGVNGNISEDPLLDGAGIPAECSPTIDAADPGLDFSAEPAPDGGRANMGHTGGTTAATPSLPDLNGDGVVDGIDMLRLSVSFGSTSADARYNSSVDVNGDGSVDGDDLALVAPDYGMSCD